MIGSDEPVRRMESVRDCTITDLVDWAVQRRLDPADVKVSAAHLKWLSEQTDEERAERETWRKAAAQRQEKWERETYTRLKAKFEEAP